MIDPIAFRNLNDKLAPRISLDKAERPVPVIPFPPHRRNRKRPSDEDYKNLVTLLGSAGSSLFSAMKLLSEAAGYAGDRSGALFQYSAETAEILLEIERVKKEVVSELGKLSAHGQPTQVE